MKLFQFIKNKKNKPETVPGILQTMTSDTAQSLLTLEQWGNISFGLTPGRLRSILQAADEGNITEQHQLFSDMEDRCEHLAAEISKRKRAILTLDWEIVPARKDNPTAIKIADAIREQFNSIYSIEDLLLDMADAIGHGFSAIEIEWEYDGHIHIPKAFHHRPQSWFQMLPQNKNILRLRSKDPEGDPLWPLGWIIHTHRSRSGWLPRAGLFRIVAWAYLVRSYALEASINYVQIHGLPFRIGKYPLGSSSSDKRALLRALQTLGKDAAGIIPSGMEIIFQSPTNTSQDLPGQLVTRCELGMSKAILGGTLTTQADGQTSTNALGKVHNEVRRDLMVTDALQISSTISKQLIMPMAALNCKVEDTTLLPSFRFDTRAAIEVGIYADALPKLSPIMDISAQWAHDKLKIPKASSKDDILGNHIR